MRLLEELIGVSSANSEYDWAGVTHTQLMMPTDTKVSSNVVFDERISAGSLEGAQTIEYTLITPKSYEVEAVIDGTAVVNTKFGIYTSGGSNVGFKAHLKKVEMKLNVIDSDGNESTSIDYFELWSGTMTSYYGGSESKKSLISWLNFSDLSIRGDERLKWYFRFTTTVSDSPTYHVYLYTGKDSEDLLIQLPFVMG